MPKRPDHMRQKGYKDRVRESTLTEQPSYTRRDFIGGTVKGLVVLAVGEVLLSCSSDKKIHSLAGDCLGGSGLKLDKKRKSQRRGGEIWSNECKRTTRGSTHRRNVCARANRESNDAIDTTIQMRDDASQRMNTAAQSGSHRLYRTCKKLFKELGREANRLFERLCHKKPNQPRNRDCEQ